jgi:hypothetical protein
MYKSIISIIMAFSSGVWAINCQLQNSGPVSASYDGQIIENLRITANGVYAINVNGYNNVILRNLEVFHSGTHGIKVNNADDILIQNVLVENTGAPASGPHSHPDQNNIQVDNSMRVRIDQVKLVRGSSGIYFYGSPNSHSSFVEGHDFRGPFPRGQLVQWNASANPIFEDFSVISPQATSWVEDNVNVYGSPGALIQRGLIDGNNSPSGIGIIFDGGEGATGHVKDVDAVRMGNGCFSNYAGGRGNIFERANCKDIICGSQGRPWNDNPNNYGPMSGGLMYTGTGGVGNYGLQIIDSKYSGACGGIVWPEESFSFIDVRQENFTLREPIIADVCGVDGGTSSSSSSISSSSSAPSSSSSNPILTGRIQAENFTNQQGVVNKGTVVGELDQGDWIFYGSVNFESGFNRVRMNAAVDPEWAGQIISFRLGNPNGPVICDFIINSTGGWTLFNESDAEIISTSGLQDLYLVAVTTNNRTSGVGDIDWFEFYTDQGPVANQFGKQISDRNLNIAPKFNSDYNWLVQTKDNKEYFLNGGKSK